MKVGKQEKIAMPTCFAVHSPNDLGKELAVKVGKNDPDRVGPCKAEASSASMRDIAEFLDGSVNALLCVLAYILEAIERARHRRDRQSGAPGNVANGGFGHELLIGSNPAKC